MDYTESLAYLGQIQEDGAKFSLENIQTIINHFPFDLQKIGFIQVGGTNGKGSTTHGIASVLIQGGYRVGVFTSPHLFDLRERIALGKQWISREDFADCLSMVKMLICDLQQRLIIKDIPTFFEHMLLTALVYFQRKQVDFVVLEVGLGGRLDATSTIRPLLTVITNVHYDHLKILGPTLTAIAQEKAGIIKPGVPMVCGCMPRSVGFRVISKRAKLMGSPFYPVFDKENHLDSLDADLLAPAPKYRYLTNKTDYRFSLTMNGRHQVYNAATIIKAVEVLNDSGVISIPVEKILQGVYENIVPGRLEWLATQPPVLIDGGHNVAGLNALTTYLDEQKLTNLTLIFGVLRDKQYRAMIRSLIPYVYRVILTEPISHRAISAQTIRPLFSKIQTVIHLDYDKALAHAFTFNNTILITGSLYLIGEMRNRIETQWLHTSKEVPS